MAFALNVVKGVGRKISRGWQRKIYRKIVKIPKNCTIMPLPGGITEKKNRKIAKKDRKIAKKKRKIALAFMY